MFEQGAHWQIDTRSLEGGVDLWRDFRVGLDIAGVQLTQVLCRVLREVGADSDCLQNQCQVVQQWRQLIPASADTS